MLMHRSSLQKHLRKGYNRTAGRPPDREGAFGNEFIRNDAGKQWQKSGNDEKSCEDDEAMRGREYGI